MNSSLLDYLNKKRGYGVEESYLTGGIYDAEPYLGSNTITGVEPITVGSQSIATTNGGLFDSLSNRDIMDGVFGVGQLGLGLFNMLENRKNNRATRNALNESVAASVYARTRHNNFVGSTQKAFR